VTTPPRRAAVDLAGRGSDSADTAPLEQFLHTRNRALRNEIVARHRGLAQHFAQRYANRGVPAEDLQQTALLALVRAVERFDASRGVEFGAFAAHVIEGALKEHFRDQTWWLHVPRRAKERTVELRRLEEQLTHELGRSPTVAELARCAEIAEDDVLAALAATSAYRATSLDAPRPDGAVDHGPLRDDPGFERVEVHSLVTDLLETLAARERRIVELRFFEGLSQSEIAERVGISQMHVSRLLRKSLGLLRERLDGVH
jgi:RNA polymerase sigma-B factor